VAAGGAELTAPAESGVPAEPLLAVEPVPTVGSVLLAASGAPIAGGVAGVIGGARATDPFTDPSLDAFSGR
jgi:hypothetical protein